MTSPPFVIGSKVRVLETAWEHLNGREGTVTQIVGGTWPIEVEFDNLPVHVFFRAGSLVAA